MLSSVPRGSEYIRSTRLRYGTIPKYRVAAPNAVSLSALSRLSARKGYRLVAVEPTGVNAFFLRSDVAPHVPACEPKRAFHLLEKYDVLMQQGEDVFRYVAQAGLSLVEVP